MANIELTDETEEEEKKIAPVIVAGRTGIVITLIAVVGAVAIMDIVAGMVVTLARIRAEREY